MYYDGSFGKWISTALLHSAIIRHVMYFLHNNTITDLYRIIDIRFYIAQQYAIQLHRKYYVIA